MIAPRVFLDANIFIAAAKSEKGGSRLILDLAKAGKLEIFTVEHALLEAEKNIQKKFGEKYLTVHQKILLEAKPRIQSISRADLKEIKFFSYFIPPKDIPILLGAFYSRSKFLITLDRKDFLSNQRLQLLKLPFEILTPGDFIQKYLL